MGKRGKLLLSALLVAATYPIARVGRLLLDYVLLLHPEWGGVGRVAGSLVVGLLIAFITVIPLLKLNGVLEKNRK
jgi:hypothetical protein